MGHTPYGYRIENGRAVIDEEKAEQVKLIFEEYLSGTALCASAKRAGMDLTHSSVKNLLTNRKYLGDAFYPAIIDEETFRRAEETLKGRAKELGKANMGPKDYKKPPIPVDFYMDIAEDHFRDPFEQAAYMYSRIKEAVDGTGQERYGHSRPEESGKAGKG